jgi:predicted transposase YdaD
VALFDGWVERLGVLRREPGGASTLAAFLWYLLTVSPIEDARIIEAAEELPEPVEEEFMTGLERLRRAAREEGREEGREAGTRHALAATLHKLLRLRFGGIPAAAAMRIEAAPTPELERWIEGVLTAESLEALLD